VSAAVIDGPVAVPEPRFGHRRRPAPMIAVALIILAVVAVLAVFGTLLAPESPTAQDLASGTAGPSGGHLLGTDQLGRDVLSRIMAGARTAVLGPLLIALGALVISSVVGILAGYTGGRTDAVIMRIVDGGYALPSLLVVAVVVGILGGGYYVSAAVLALLFAPYDIRIIRAVALQQRSLPYVEAARTLGLSRRQIMVRHIWPNVVPFVVVNACLDFAFGLVTLSGLSFLGLAAASGAADWGLMLADGKSLIFGSPLAALAPGAMIVLLAMSVSLAGDWLYQVAGPGEERR
jgi:peptide/nickel transport system permease protein